MLKRSALAIASLAITAIVVFGYTHLSKQANVIDIYGNPSFAQKDGVLYYQEAPFTGTAVERFPDRVISKSTEYVNGIRHGISEEYGFTGSIKHRWNYVNGIKQGPQHTWYLEGPKKTLQHFKDGLLHGESTEWFISGQLFRKRQFEKGVEVAHKVHFSTGELHTNYVKRDGAIYGLKTGELCMDFKDDGELE